MITRRLRLRSSTNDADTVVRLCSVLVHRRSSKCDGVVRTCICRPFWYRQLAAPAKPVVRPDCQTVITSRSTYWFPALATPPAINKTLSALRMREFTEEPSLLGPHITSTPTISVRYDRSLLCARYYCTHPRLPIIRQYPSAP
jgi:hypothetical protein